MSSKIINSHRYNKTTKKKIEKQKKEIRINNIKSKNNSINTQKNSSFRSKKVKKENNILSSKLFKITCLCSILILISIVSKKIVKMENIPILNVFSNSDENDNLVKGYDFKIGLQNLDTTDITKTNNVILNEILFKSKNRLISINNNYTINYIVANKIEKINNKEYKITLNKDKNLSAKNIVDSIDKIKQIGKENIYYENISNIESTNVVSDYIINVKLKNDNPYFVYTLNFPLYNEGYLKSSDSNYEISNVNENTISFTNNSSNSLLKSINITKYTDIDHMVSDFRNNNLDMFIASTDSTVQLIGKHDYSIKKYRDGETVFLLGNKNSSMFSKKEIRQALLYATNRDLILKQVNPTFSELIDLPYIYSGIKYKYDIYGAENGLLSNGWKKENGIYSKEIDGSKKNIEMNLLVNESDKDRVQIADSISQMMGNIGIKINVIKLNETDINKRVASGNYDILLASVYISEIPDISFLEQYLNINDSVNEAINKVKESSVENIAINIQNLQNVLSSEIACIGIIARNTDIVYQKNILGFENTEYMKIFNDFKNIGKQK